MKILRLLSADLKRVYFVLAALIVCVGAFYVALPKTLKDRGMQISARVGVISEDADASGMAALFVETLGMIEEVTYAATSPEEILKAQEMLDHGEIDYIIEFPKDTIERLTYGRALTIRMAAKDPLYGSVGLYLLKQATDAIEGMQRVAFAYYDMTDAADSAFELSLMRLALLRGSLLHHVRSVNQYDLQICAFILFIIASIASAYMVFISTERVNAGRDKRLALHGIGTVKLFFYEYFAAVFIALVMSVLAIAFFALLKIESVNSLRMVCSSLILVTLTYPVYALFTCVSAARKHCVLIVFILFIVMLFVGGGFYPAYLMKFSIQKFNAAWLAHILSEWILKGKLNQNAVYPFVIPAILCAAATVLLKRREL